LLSCSVLASAWAFYVILGELAGFGSEQINAILTFSVLFTLVGSTLASVVGHRFGRLLPSILGILMMTVSIVGLSLSRDPTHYRVLTGLNLFGLYIFVPYFLGYAAGADQSGRGPAIVAGAFMLAAAIGPYLGGIVISRFGIEYLALIAVVANSVSLALFCIVNNMQKRPGKALD
jgi:predicted MFS family arabinose efflux permease